MSFELDRLQRATSIVDGNGLPSSQFQRLWQATVEKIEGAIDNIRQILIDLGFAQETADGALELAQSAIEPGGTIKDSKVLTTSITGNGVTDRYFARLIGELSLPDGVETDIVSVTVVKGEDESDVDLDPSIRLKSSDDIQGLYRLYRGAEIIDEFDPFLKGAGGDFRIALTFPFTDIGIPAGTYVYKMTFTRQGGASSLFASEDSLLRAKEFKR